MADPVFIGRERELAQLQGFLQRSLAGEGQVAFVAGDAGRGKTALVREFTRRAEDAHDDLVAAIGNCNAQTGSGDPYLPFREILRLLTGDIESDLAANVVDHKNATRLRGLLVHSTETLIEIGPDLIGLLAAGVPGASLVIKTGRVLADKAGWLDKLEKMAEKKPATISGDTRLESGRILEQYTNVLITLARLRPLLVVLDDLQWADMASIELLFHLSRRISGSRIFILGAYRPDEVALGRPGETGGRHPLEKVLVECKRYFGDIWVDLNQVQVDEGRAFVNALLDQEPNRLGNDFRAALLRHTGGHPLFTIELLRTMQERGDLIQDQLGRWVEGPALDWRTLPARVEGVIEERIGRLEESLRQLLAVASVEGEEFTVQVLARVQAMRERQLLQTLSQELEKRHRLVLEQGEVKVGRQMLSRYQFAHVLFQQYLYNDLSSGERRLLHGEIAGVLEELYQGHTDAITVQLARHYSEAGEGEKAVGYLLPAGDRARALYAYAEAIEHYQRALDFLKEQRDYERAARTLMKLGLTYHIAFDFRRARQAYDEGFLFWQRAAGVRPATLPPAPHALRLDQNEPRTLDPALAGDFVSISVIDQLFTGLVERTPEMDIIPAVACAWEVAEGGCQYTFRLRPDARWSDGTPLTADDFADAWKRVLTPATASPTAPLLYDIKGARAFHHGETTDPNSVGIRATDPATLVVELEGPTSYFPHLLAHPVCCPLPRHIVAARGPAWTDTETLVTNGPFRLEKWQRGRSMTLARNPDYCGRRSGNVERVELTFFSHGSVGLETYPGLADYQADRLDRLVLANLPPAEREAVRQEHAEEYLSGPWLVTSFVRFNARRPPFDDGRVRQALAHAADREMIADVTARGFVFPATGGFVPPGMAGHAANIGLHYDPNRARQLLAEAGYPGGRGFPAVEMLLTSPNNAPASATLAMQWRENLGITIIPRMVGFAALQERIAADPPQMLLESWLADYPDPDSFLRVGLHHYPTGWRDNTYDQLIETARRATDQPERMQRYIQADRILMEAAVILPIFYSRFHLLVKPWVKRFPTSAVCLWFWKDVVIEPHPAFPHPPSRLGE